MALVDFNAGTIPQQVEGFPQDCKRSAAGALHIRPGVVSMTDDEWTYIKINRPDLRRNMRLIERKLRPTTTAVLRTESSETAESTVSPFDQETPRPSRSRRGGSIPDAD